MVSPFGSASTVPLLGAGGVIDQSRKVKISPGVPLKSEVGRKRSEAGGLVSCEEESVVVGGRWCRSYSASGGMAE